MKFPKFPQRDFGCASAGRCRRVSAATWPHLGVVVSVSVPGVGEELSPQRLERAGLLHYLRFSARRFRYEARFEFAGAHAA